MFVLNIDLIALSKIFFRNMSVHMHLSCAGIQTRNNLEVRDDRW